MQHGPRTPKGMSLYNRHCAAMGAGMRNHAFRELASVKRRALRLRDALKRSRVGGRDKFLPRLRDPGVGHEVLSKARHVL
jgi:hypothetical protein